MILIARQLNLEFNFLLHRQNEIIYPISSLQAALHRTVWCGATSVTSRYFSTINSNWNVTATGGINSSIYCWPTHSLRESTLNCCKKNDIALLWELTPTLSPMLLFTGAIATTRYTRWRQQLFRSDIFNRQRQPTVPLCCGWLWHIFDVHFHLDSLVVLVFMISRSHITLHFWDNKIF